MAESMSDWQDIATAPRDGTPLLDWQVVRYGDSPETRAGLAYWRERGWPVDDPSWDDELKIGAFKAGYRAALPAPPRDADTRETNDDHAVLPDCVDDPTTL